MSSTDPVAPKGMDDLRAGRDSCVLLVGHGSHLSPDSARPVHGLARRLHDAGAFREVRVAFWKEEPALHHAFHLVESSRVHVVPVFTSTGYFTERVVPRELGLDRTLVDRPGLRVHRCAALGTHPRMAEVVLERALEATPLSPEPLSEATLVVAGHGTRRHPDSGRTTERIANELSGQGRFRRVVPAFLDQDPRLTEVLEEEDAVDVVVVPFFIAEGWHAGTTIPDDLALRGGRSVRNGTSIWYAKPVGTHSAMVDVILDLVTGWETGEEAPFASTEPPPPAVAREAFLDWIGKGGSRGRRFLETWIHGAGEGRFEVRHHLDRSADPAGLRELETFWEGLEIAATTAQGKHRPLRTAPGLRRGWCFSGRSGREVWELFAHLYPAAPVHWHLERGGRLRPRTFRQVALRQSGIYAGLEETSDPNLIELAGVRCGPEGCLRHPTWAPASTDPGIGRSHGVPCPEPCSLFITGVRKQG